MLRRWVIVVLPVVLAVSGCGAGSHARTQDAASGRTTRVAARTTTVGRAAPRRVTCGSAMAAKPIKHVIWIWFENKRFDEIVGRPGSTAARTNPYLDDVVARRCARFDRFSSEVHPSLGNYIAAVTGSTAGVPNDCPPSACRVDRPSIFGQLRAAGSSWRSFAEGAPHACTTQDSGQYLVRHDPVPYLIQQAGDCPKWDLPLGSVTRGPFASELRTRTLTAFTSITPNVCDDSHDCAVSVADTWLRKWLSVIGQSAAYRAGDVLVFVTWDEGNKGGRDGEPSSTCPVHELRSDCHVATFVMAPSVTAGTHVLTPVDHYAMLQLTQSLLHVGPPLGPNRSREVAALRRLLHLQ